jgi:hypothetical protein
VKLRLSKIPWLNTILLAGGGFLILVLAAGLFVSFAFPDLCENDQATETFAPNGKLKAVSFRRACGATTGYSTQVSILAASKRLPNKSGNIFVVGGEPSVVVRWIDDHHLSISGGGAATSFRHESEFQGIKITYD